MRDSLELRLVKHFMKTLELTQLIYNTLEEHRATNIASIDVSSRTDITDLLIICSARSKRHAKSLADRIIKVSKNNGFTPYGVEGKTEAVWILVDLQDIIIHILLPEVREFYHLEKLWHPENAYC